MKMAYDKLLDKEKFSKTVEFEKSEFEKTSIKVSVYVYDEGTPKVQISRENTGKDGTKKWVKLGRMNKQEVEAIIPFMEEALKEME